MIRKAIKYGVVPVVALLLVGGLMFGSDLGSYISSSARSVRESVKDSVPTEFELQRARDLLEQIVPEMHANIRLIAQVKVFYNLLDDITAFNDIWGLCFMMSFRETDNVNYIGIHIHLHVSGYRQVSLGHIKVWREAGKATPGLLNDIKIMVTG